MGDGLPTPALCAGVAGRSVAGEGQSELGLVDASGWMLVLWPRPNTEQSDLYQTWMGIETWPDVGTAMAMPATATRNFNCGD